jgi:hypothetical protein
MSEVASGYIINEERYLGDDTFKIVLINNETNDGFSIDINNYSIIEDEDLEDMLRDAVDSRLDELEIALIDNVEKEAEGEYQGFKGKRKGWEINKTNNPVAPKISGAYPPDGEADVPVDIDKIAVTISDRNGDLMTCSITTSPNIGFINITEPVGNGQVTVSVSGLLYSQIYTWSVSVDDGTGNVADKDFTFITEDAP